MQHKRRTFLIRVAGAASACGGFAPCFRPSWYAAIGERPSGTGLGLQDRRAEGGQGEVRKVRGGPNVQQLPALSRETDRRYRPVSALSE